MVGRREGTRLLLLVVLGMLFACHHGSAQAPDQTGMPEGLQVLDFKSEEEMDRVLFDPQDGAARHRTVVIGIYEPQCRDLVEQTWFTWGSVRHSDPALITVARIEREVAPRMVRIMEIPDYLCLSAVFVPRGGDRGNMRGFPVDLEIERDWFSWVFQQLRVEVAFNNIHDRPITLHFLEGTDTDMSPSDHIIAPGGSSVIQTFVGHVFYTRDAETEELLDWLEVEGEGSYTVGHDLRPDCGDRDQGRCEEKETTLLRFVYGVLYRGRMALNAIQPSRVQAFTETGFERHKLPENVYGPLYKYWETMQDGMVPETRVGPAINQLDSPTFIMVYPDDMKERLFDGIKPSLEAWSGRALEATSCYGIRKYTNGSRLLMHVDTMDTHAVSAIINVDQEVQEPWELQIQDHQGNMHYVTMEPGDILYYESAKLLHGRPVALKGSYFANIFVHFRPTEGWEPLPL